MNAKFSHLTDSELAEQLYDAKCLYRASENDDAPAVYVSTFDKYNRGSLGGMWVDLTAFEDYDEFVDFCTLLHYDDDDPEFMMQDFENFPEELYDEGMSRKDFDRIHLYCELIEQDKEIVDAYLELYGWDDHLTWEHINDLYQGCYDSEEAFAEYLVDEVYYDEIQRGGFLCQYIDYERMARDLFMCDYDISSDGHVWATH